MILDLMGVWVRLGPRAWETLGKMGWMLSMGSLQAECSPALLFVKTTYSVLAGDWDGRECGL